MLFPAPIVVQTPLWAPDGVRCGSAFVGVMAPEHEADGTTVVVRASYRFSSQGGLQYEVDQSEAHRSAEEQNPSPWARNKEACDLALQGQAYASKAQESIAVNIAVGEEFRRSFVVRGPSAIEAMPLEDPFVFGADGQKNVSVGAGELRPTPAEKARELSPADHQEHWAEVLRRIEAGELDFGSPVSVDGSEQEEAAASEASWHQRLTQPGLRSWEQLLTADVPLGESSQWAEAEMRCELPQGTEQVGLQGLARGGESLQFTVAPHQLLVVAEAGLRGYDVLMRIDGLVFDALEGRWLVEWRGQVPDDLFAHPDSRLIVHFADPQAVPSLFDIDARLSRGHFQRAATPADQASAMPDTSDVALQLARQRTLTGPVVPFLEFEHYARMRAKLVGLPEGPRQAALQAAGLDNFAWLVEDRAWTERIRGARLDGDRSEYMFYTKTLSQYLSKGKSQV